MDHSQVKDYLGRFQGIPDLLELDHLTVSGENLFSISLLFVQR